MTKPFQPKQPDDFGKRLRALRLQANITTQRELVDLLAGKDVYYDYTVVSHWESGRRRPSLQTLIAIIQVLVEAGSIKDVATANELLRLADMRGLSEDEIARIFDHLFTVVEPELPVSIFDEPSTMIDIPPVSSWSHQSDGGIASVDVSADGSRILAGTLGKRVVCFDKNSKVLWLAKVGNQAWRVALSADGQTAVVGTGSTRPWDMGGRGLYTFGGDGRLRWQQDLGASVWGLALAADGRTVAVGTDGHEAILLDGEGNFLWRRRMTGLGWWAWVWTVALSADGRTVVVGSANKSLLVLDRGGNLLGEHDAGADVHAVAVSANGQTVAAGSSDQQVYLLDGQGRLLWCEKLKDKVWAVALSADGQRLVVGAGEKEAHVRTFDRGGQSLWKRYVEGGVSRVAVSAGGKIVVVGTRAGHVHIFDGDGEPVYHYMASKIIRDVAVSTDARVAVAGSEDRQVYGFLLPQRPRVSSPLGEGSPLARTKHHGHIEHT